MYLVKTPRLLQTLMPGYTWRMPASETKTLYLTFDDGPIPDVTPWVLAQLASFDAQATFFCVGENVQRHPDIFQTIQAQGHAVGSHTQTHKDGWQTEDMAYFHDARQCAQLVKSDLFRPPYGRITLTQKAFLERHYRIIMWDVLSGDFDVALNPDQCLLNVLNHARNGSIVVMHDSLKSWPRLEYVLPRVLEHFASNGYVFKSLESQEQPVALVSVMA